MDRETLSRLLSSKVRTVEFEGHQFVLKPPKTAEVAAILGSLQSADDPGLDDMHQAMQRALLATMSIENGAATEEDVDTVLSFSGHLGSPIGQAALELCGWRFDTDADEAETDRVFP